jgi:hypothetical protein
MVEGSRKRSRVIWFVTAGAAIALVAALLGRTFAAADDDSKSQRTMAFVVHFSPFNVIELPPEGLSVGDITVFHDELFNADKKQVGDEAGYCPVTMLITTGVEIVCTVAVSLAGGQITLQGVATNAPTKPLAVTGGTRQYRATSGEAELVENGDGTGTLTLHLVG